MEMPDPMPRAPVRGALMLGTLLAITSCGGETPRDGPGEAPGRAAEVEDGPGAAPPEPTGDSLGTDAWLDSAFLPATAGMEDLVARFGAPERRSATARPNRHDPSQTDSIVTLDFAEGVTARFYAVTGGRTFLSEAVVSEPGILPHPDIDVGRPWAEARRILGPPDGEREGDPYYVCETCGEVDEPVYFEVRDGVIRRIRFTYYVD